MEFPKPTIDVEAAASELRFDLPTIPDMQTGDDAAFKLRLRALLAQAWEEGRWSPPGATLNPYGEPAQPHSGHPQEEWPAGEPLRQLRLAARNALAWVENMAPTVRRTALAEQLRSALEGM